MKELLLQTYTLVLPIILGYIVWLLKNQKRDRDANSKGTMLLLRVQLIEYHSKYMQIGDIPSYAYENFCEMYEAYHALGGNGMITKMMHEIEELHLKRKVINYGTDYELCKTGTCGCSNCIVFHRNVAEKGRDGDR